MKIKLSDNVIETLYDETTEKKLTLDQLKEKYSRDLAKKNCKCVKCDSCKSKNVKKINKVPVKKENVQKYVLVK